MSRLLEQFNLRMPSELKEWVEGVAKVHRRSVNSQIVYFLERMRSSENKKAAELPSTSASTASSETV